MSFQTLATSLLVSLAIASPVAVRQTTTDALSTPEPSWDPTTYVWTAGWENEYPIHQSCNDTLRGQLKEALDETVELAKHARDHLLRWGDKSEIARRYFGNSSTLAIGWYDRVVNADKAGMTFRCDDPDRNCATQDNWAGHWRGENATEETVICPRSFEIRRHLSSVCGLGYTVVESPLNTFWATDLLHRVLHVPTISQDLVHHYTEDYAGILELAKTDSSKTVLDSDALQYFAIDAWAYDIAAPGIGCTGELPVTEEKPTSTESSTPTGTQSASKVCIAM
ncbi:Major allergen Asp [Paramyrothecium foliicola]|nr:Major allergen Asp [Paramyrothecium foliicola]